MTGADVPAGGRRPARRPLATRTTWETIPSRAEVLPGDLLRFSWTPHGWTQPIRLLGMVHCAAQTRRTWLVAVDTVTGIPGQWRVRKQADSTLSGEPVWPADEHWWQNNFAGCVPLVTAGEVTDASGQLELFKDAIPPRPPGRVSGPCIVLGTQDSPVSLAVPP